jgi:hypothetical protein
MPKQQLPHPRSVAWSAFRAGSLVSVLLRSSSHSASGRVLVCQFKRGASASAFARRWAARLGISIFVRCAGWAGRWEVSVPVHYPSSHLPAWGLVPCVGGVRGFARSLASCGFAPPVIQGVQHV